MQRITKHIASLLTAALVPILAGCISVQSIDAPRTQMTVRQARTTLVDALRQSTSTKDLRDVVFSRRSVSYKYTGTYAESAGVTYSHRIAFADVKALSIVGGDGVTMTDVFQNGELWKRFDTHRAAEAFADAVLTLREAALAPDTEEADFAAFTTSAQAWLATNPKPGMSDDARTQKLLAEDAFKRKDFTAALEAYVEALERYPMWPEGHYNAALLAAEGEDYELAAHHLRRYLVLAPDAKDAATARDKLLLWQHKAKG